MVKCAKCGTKAATWSLFIDTLRARELESDEDSDDCEVPFLPTEHCIVRMFQCAQCFALCSQRLPAGVGKMTYPVVVLNDTFSLYVKGAFGDEPSKEEKTKLS